MILNLSTNNNNKNKYPLTDDLKGLAKIFNKHGFSLYIVGGAVRDYLLGKKSNDVDFTTNATPQEMLRIFPNAIKTGIKHGTLTIPYKKNFYECTTFRVDKNYTDSRHPDDVDFTNNLHEDLKRRDFTINAMCADCYEGNIIDDFEGITDLQRHLVRTVGNPEERFSEDALRLLRAVRFATILNFSIECKTFSAIKELANTITFISRERINQELVKILNCDFAGAGLLKLYESDLLQYILPIFLDTFANKELRNEIINKLSDNSFRVNRIEVRLAILFSYVKDHDLRKILRDLKFTNKTLNLVQLLTTNQLSNKEYDSVLLKKLIKTIGKNNVETFLDFNRVMRNDNYIFNKNKKNIDIVLQSSDPINICDLCVNGDDVIKMGFAGKDIGKVLDYALNLSYQNPELNKNKKLFCNLLIKSIKL